MIQKHNKGQKSFTLIELLIVVVIIGILSVALIPRLIGLQGKARDTARKADIDQLTKALALYASENGGNYPNSNSNARCIGVTGGTKCRPGYAQNGGGTGVGMGNTGFNQTLLSYLSSIPLDPLSNRSIGNSYIYMKSESRDYVAIHCNGSLGVYEKAWIARQPEKIAPSTDEACSPGKRACCGPIGCGSHNFCVLQLN